MRIAPRSYSLSVDLRVSNVPRQDFPISDCWALNGAAIRHAAPKTAAIGSSDLGDWRTVTIAEPDSVRLPKGDDLTSRLIRLSDSGCLLQGSQDFFARHQYGRLAGLDRTASSYGQCDSGHGFVVGHIGDDDEIVITEAIPTSEQFSPDSLARLAAHGFNTVLRVFNLRSPGLCGLRRLVHIDRHIRSPSRIGHSQQALGLTAHSVGSTGC